MPRKALDVPSRRASCAVASMRTGVFNVSIETIYVCGGFWRTGLGCPTSGDRQLWGKMISRLKFIKDAPRHENSMSTTLPAVDSAHLAKGIQEKLRPCALAVVLVMLTFPSQAQTFTVLHNFKDGTQANADA